MGKQIKFNEKAFLGLLDYIQETKDDYVESNVEFTSGNYGEYFRGYISAMYKCMDLVEDYYYSNKLKEN